MVRRITLADADGTGAWREWDGEPTVGELAAFLNDLDPGMRVASLIWEEVDRS